MTQTKFIAVRYLPYPRLSLPFYTDHPFTAEVTAYPILSCWDSPQGYFIPFRAPGKFTTVNRDIPMPILRICPWLDACMIFGIRPFHTEHPSMAEVITVAYLTSTVGDRCLPDSWCSTVFHRSSFNGKSYCCSLH